jgi:hypothetical protein
VVGLPSSAKSATIAEMLYEAPKKPKSKFVSGLWAAGFLLAALALVFFSLAVLLRSRPGATPVVEQVNTLSILHEITTKYEVVTKSIFVDQATEITYDQGDSISNWLWGQTITARGVVQVDVGVDLTDLSEADVVVDEGAKTVTVAVPPAQVLAASKFGKIDIENDQGILHYAFENDQDGDFNLALDRLLEEASRAAEADAKTFAAAREEAARVIRLIVEGLGYELIVADPPEQA